MLRIKCSHNSLDEITETFEHTRRLIKKMGTQTTLLADLPEAKIRLGDIEAEKEFVKKGESYAFRSAESSVSIKEFIPVVLDHLGTRVSAGDRIVVGDGIAAFIVQKISSPDLLTALAENSAPIVRRSALTIPDAGGGEHQTDETWEMVERLREIAPGYLAFSFVDSAATMRRIREKVLLITGDTWHPKLIAKIENAAGVANAAAIVREADLIMVARGDLALAIPIARLPSIQRELCRVAKESGTPIIVATGILDSMESSPFPSRAEVCDVANIVRDGADWAMLCRATAHAFDPGAVIRMAKSIIAETKS
jgi:pyruvate kinase